MLVTFHAPHGDEYRMESSIISTATLVTFHAPHGDEYEFASDTIDDISDKVTFHAPHGDEYLAL